MIVWINGAAGSGKSTLARLTTLTLTGKGYSVRWLDGDDVRRWLTPDCSYNTEDRQKHLARVHRVATLISSKYMTVVCSFVGLPPVRVDRHVHLTGRERQPPWEGTTWPTPDQPALVLNTGKKGTNDCLSEIMSYITS